MEEIKTKKCSKCGEEKELNEFYKSSKSKDGHNCQCRNCSISYYYKNSEKISKKNKIHYENNKDEVKERVNLYRESNSNIIKERKAIYYITHRDKIKEYREKNQENIIKYEREYYKRIAKYEVYKDKLTIEEDPIDINGELWCRCSFCKEHYLVTIGEIKNRIGSLNGRKTGEHRLYCSDKCKKECDIYNAQTIPKSLRNVKKQSRCNQQLNKDQLLFLQIDECGYNYCEKCGKPFLREDLIIHHNILVGKDHTMVDDMSHQMIVCAGCHDHKGC